ncbi:MerR family transcriptional regulator [Frigoribacterium sp. CFBP9039]|uniref:MerR family transcriptional regulator n=1 Tax=Frigoribacterium sp. CFBP9029 TaxID=3096541 RepID=UPI002A69F045|nr:MerR family transcriptional regulator [Frigoribacterium sp. CFBP9039]MDY0946243.1 MerR family transcriptional regulator [Frigoribacterium sp. CFBP9039]
MATSNGMMHIGELAERSEMSLRSLRHYDEIGLLSASGRTEGGFRLYTETDYERLILIRRMKPLGFSLDEMADLLRIIDALENGSDENRRAELSAELSGFVEQTITRREKLRRQLEMADEFLELLRTR